MRFYIALLFSLLAVAQLRAQQFSMPFGDGEQLNYRVSYNWKFVWVDAGKVRFTVDSTTYEGRPAFRFSGNGRSLTTYDWIYRVRDVFTSVSDAITLQPYIYHRNTDEDGYKVKNSVQFDYARHEMIAQTENSNRPMRIDTLPVRKFTLDVLTAVYYARARNFDEFETGEKIPLTMVIDGKVYDLFGRYQGIEHIENYDGQVYRCHKFTAMLVGGTIFEGGEDLLVWFTADQNHIPILVEAKILVGSVKAYFLGGKNIRFPMNALIN